ncbi:MAG: hypothetical protein QNJ89_04845 [Acidimicrobiia bacterium]|nr:hypothetical protein [Acidimicrobiia bacterium]
MPFVFLVHLGATWALVGLIWFVQVVHYPLFGHVGRAAFAGYEEQHTRRTGWVVGVLMPAEAITALWLVVSPPAEVGAAWFLLGLALVGALWLTTLVVHVPLHRQLSRGFDTYLGNRLVWTNWIRTLLWTARGLLVLFIGSRLLS